jgi:hypothetical protein
MTQQTGRRGQAGVSLIEALIALAIMAIGMLGIVGVQSTLRATSDVAKQRSEATRIAQVELERWRSFLTLTGGGGINYEDLVAGAVDLPVVTGANATYALRRVVENLPAPRRGKSISLLVTWNDRAGRPESVQLSSLIAGISPELTLSGAVVGAGDLLQQPNRRKRGIPLGAKELGGGKSGWIPPNSPGGTAWVFDNATGLITLCTTTATTTGDLIYDVVNPVSNNVSCGTNLARYVGGFVRYALGSGAPTNAQAIDPPSTPADLPAGYTVTVAVDYVYVSTPYTQGCFVRHVIGTPPASSYTEYHCAVPVSITAPGVPPSWEGVITVGPPTALATSLAETSDSLMKVCRYHAAASYVLQVEPLSNQNFLMIRAGDGAAATPTAYNCPTPTVAHQPTS